MNRGRESVILNPSNPVYQGGIGTRSMTPTNQCHHMQKPTLFKKLDFYGRKLKHDQMMDQQNHQRLNSLSSDIQPNITNNQQLHDTIELELRSQLDVAKSDLTHIQKTIESQIKKEINKYPQFANEESEVAKRIEDLYQKFEIFENEIVRRTKDLLNGYSVLKNEQTNL